VGLLAVTRRAAQPLGEEQLLHRPAGREVAREQRAQLIVVPDPLVQQVNQPVDRRLAAGPLEQTGTTESPETRRMIQQAAVLKSGHRLSFPAVALGANSIVLATICGRGRFGI
jgi:hypothetical protein